MQKLLTFFRKNIRVYAICNDQSFNDTLTNDFISFEQMGPEQESFRSFLYPLSQKINISGNTCNILMTKLEL